MSDTLHVLKKRVIEYASTGFFHGSYGTNELHQVLNALDVEYTNETFCPEYERDFEIKRDSLTDAIGELRKIEKGEEPTDVDVEYLSDALDNANITLPELIDCFNFLLKTSDQTNDYIYVSFF